LFKLKGTTVTARAKILVPRVESNVLRAKAHREFEEILGWSAAYCDSIRAFEPALWLKLCALGCIIFQLFLAEREARLAPVLLGVKLWQTRMIHTVMGVVRFGRWYVRHKDGGGSCPLDRDVGLHVDAISPHLAGLGARMATHSSYASASEILGWFLPKTICGSVLQRVALGFGAHTQEFFDHLVPPDNDGEVAVTMIDCKCIPTATEAELRKRRGSRKKRAKASSARHRRLVVRTEAGSKVRRKPGDKAKNGKQVVVVVVFTLKRVGGQLLGPLNKRVYCVVGPKELGFVWARSELAKRGFGPEAKGRVVQMVTDGDPDLQKLADKYIPHAERTLDYYHAVEYVAEAGRVMFGKKAADFTRWFGQAKRRILAGKVDAVLQEIRAFRGRIAKRGPGTKTKRTALDRVLNYLEPRKAMMNYDALLDLDMDIGSGAVEGAVRYLVAMRFDQGGMRWTRARANALLQLRCIEKNGMWEQYLATIFDGPAAKIRVDEPILHNTPAPLPEVKNAALLRSAAELHPAGCP
jgi:hypothetical protein